MNIYKSIFCFLVIMLGGCATQMNSQAKGSVPKWVVTPESYFDKETGIGCEAFNNALPNEELRGISQRKAMIDLLKKLNGKQKLYANESLTLDGVNKGNYRIEIKSKTYGKIGRNTVVKEGVVKNQEHISTYCSAVQLVKK